jgi:hypothetical protein
MLYSWLLLRRIHVLNSGEELLLLMLTAAGAAVGFLGATAALRLFPHL